MRVRSSLPLRAAAAAVTLLGVALPAQSAGAAGPPRPSIMDVARQVLAPGDGWAAADTGTTGGSAADAAHVFLVRDRAGLVAALAGDGAPRIVVVSGRIDVNVDDANNPVGCDAYADPGYTLTGYLAAYDPAVWGTAAKPSGPIEDARARSAKNQAARIQLKVPSNTTLIGLAGSRLVGANLVLNKVDNVILRNLAGEDAHDCFPQWDPTDGSAGNWNSAYDTVSLTGATHVWVDHSSFSDGNNSDADQPLYFGRPYQVHDGLLDITKAADLVTVSYNRFFDHDKTMLIGSTDTVGADVGHLRVTLHHNAFANVGQRAPRVRFGQVDVYDNYYVLTDEDAYSYSWGVGVYSAIYAENNFVLRSADVPLDAVVHGWGGTAMTEIGTLVRVGTQPPQPVSLLAAYNATHDPDLGPDAGWTPTLRAGPLTPTAQVPAVVSASAGAGRLGS